MSPIQKAAEGTISESLEYGRRALLRAGIEEAREESARLLMNLSGLTRVDFQLKATEFFSPEIQERFSVLLEKRKRGTPLAYLLHEADFWQETLFVNKHCLIPRPETEILVESVLQALRRRGKGSFSMMDVRKKEKQVTVTKQKSDCHLFFLDIGTGSGAIAIAILREFQNAHETLLDISLPALEVAGKNLKRYSLENRARLVRGDLFQSFRQDEQWDVIVSNPPYLAAADWETVQEELKAEPRIALDGGNDGLDFYRRIIDEAKGHLSPRGMLALEVGQGQAETVSTWLREAGYDNIQRLRDYSGVERVLLAGRGN